MSAYRIPGRTSIRQAARWIPATGGITLWHLLELISVGYGPAAAIAVAKAAGGGPCRIAIAVALGLLVGVPSPIILHEVGRAAFKAGVQPLPMYVAAALFPFALGALAAVITHHVISVLAPSR